MTEIERPGTESADEVADLWVALAEDQREHGSHLKAGVNRGHIREAAIRHIVSDTLLVARAEGRVVGFVMFSVESGVFEQDVRRGFVENLYVVPEHRDGGVGASLLDAAERALDESGCDVVALEVLAPNESARRFYERHGYEGHRIEMEKGL